MEPVIKSICGSLGYLVSPPIESSEEINQVRYSSRGRIIKRCQRFENGATFKELIAFEENMEKRPLNQKEVAVALNDKRPLSKSRKWHIGEETLFSKGKEKLEKLMAEVEGKKNDLTKVSDQGSEWNFFEKGENSVTSRLKDPSVFFFDYWSKEELLALLDIEFPEKVFSDFEGFLKDLGDLQSVANKFKIKTGSEKPGDLICKKRRAIKLNRIEINSWNANPILHKTEEIRRSIGMYVQVLFEEGFCIKDIERKVTEYFKNDDRLLKLNDRNKSFTYFVEWRDYFILSKEYPVRLPKFKDLPNSQNIECFLNGNDLEEFLELDFSDLDYDLVQEVLNGDLSIRAPTITVPVKRKRIDKNIFLDKGSSSEDPEYLAKRGRVERPTSFIASSNRRGKKYRKFWTKTEIKGLVEIEYPDDFFKRYRVFLKNKVELKNIEKKFKNRTNIDRSAIAICRKRKNFIASLNKINFWNKHRILTQSRNVYLPMGMYIQMLLEENVPMIKIRHKVINFFKNKKKVTGVEIERLKSCLICWKEYFIIQKEYSNEYPKFKNLPNLKKIEDFLKGNDSHEPLQLDCSSLNNEGVKANLYDEDIFLDRGSSSEDLETPFLDFFSLNDDDFQKIVNENFSWLRNSILEKPNLSDEKNQGDFSENISEFIFEESVDFVASRLRDSSVSSFDYWPKEELLALFKIQFPKEVSNSFDEFLKDSGNLESIAEKFEKKTGSKKPGDLICRKRRAIKFNFNEVAGWNAKPVLKKVQQIRSSIGMYVQVLFEENFLIEDSKNKVIKYFKNDQESNTVFKYFIEWRDYFILSEEDPVRCPKFKGLPDSKNIEPFLKGVYSNELDSNLYENLLKFRLTTTAPVKRKRVEENTPLNGDRSGKNKKGEFVSF